ncbi:MAG: DUF2341 domain-containing protein [Chitinispirillaceae bacterium]|nr:DUF2341 domain-containing protein [Chitinispirillaceae bacterium]
MRTILSHIIFLLTVSGLVSCVQTVSHGGGGSEVEVTGYVVSGDNTPASLTQVKLIPQEYDAVSKLNGDAIQIDTSDISGRYSFKDVAPGTYNVQALQLTERTRALVTGIIVGDKDTILPQETLHSPGKVKLLLPYGATHEGYVTIPGTDFVSSNKPGSSEIILDSIPQGIVPAIVYTINDTISAPSVLRNVQVKSYETTVITDSSWQKKQRIVLNTSSGGANISGAVYGFPVLVRLTSAIFDFAQAQPDGKDIRFTSSKGAALHHEIERWDPLRKSAEIWIKVDTIYGNNNTQSIMMYWGSAAASDRSSSQIVFDTTAGFEGVWHLGETYSNKAMDATGNRFDGESYHMSEAPSTEGVIGNARVFDGDSGYISMPNTASGKLNFSENDTFTLSAWVYADTFDNTYRTIASKGYQQYFLQLSYFPSKEKPLWQFSTYYQNDNWHMTDYTAAARTWVHLTCVKKGNLQYLYCNGELVDETAAIYSHEGVAINRDTTDNFSIGRFMKEPEYPTKFGYCYFKGIIDELRLSSITRSADWIRLSYMNQRSDDKLVQFR